MEKSVYVALAERLDMNITGAPKKDGVFSPAFLEYLELLFTPEEAEVASFLTVDPKAMTAQEVAEKSGRPVEEVGEVLHRLGKRGVIIGLAEHFMLPVTPLLLNIHPFRDTDDEESKKAAELYQKYYIEDGFYKYYTSSAAGTPQRRAVPVDESISMGQQVLSHEGIDFFLDQANMGAYTLAPCPCRTRTEKMGIRECKGTFPVASCLFLGLPAKLMVGRGEGKQVTRDEARKYLEESREHGLVMMADNAEEMKDGVICLCCGCCCSTTRGITRWDNPDAFARSDFVAKVSDECVACGNCVDRCMFDAISLGDDDDIAQVDESKCMGCGVCTVTCTSESLRLERFEREPIYPTPREMRAKVADENEAAGQKRPLT
jgi:ferredoxin